jgi:glycosyltransferase involved in cell wall biosynthesis
MRIAIIHAKFNPSLNYVESVIARELHRQGHEVKVFTTSAAMMNAGRSHEAIDAEYGFEIIRARFWLGSLSIQIPLSFRVPLRLKRFRPQVAIALAPHHGPGSLWSYILPKECRLVTGFSDLPKHRHRKFVWKFFKLPMIKAVVSRAQSVIAITAETKHFLTEQLGEKLGARMLVSGLPYDHHAFYPSAHSSERYVSARVKQEHLSEANIVVLATRADPAKNLDQLLVEIRDFLIQSPTWRFVFVGVMNDFDLLRWRALFAESGLESAVEINGMVSSDALREIFQVARVSLWPSVSIGMIHSLACGCPVVIASGVTHSHFMFSEASVAMYSSGKVAQALLKFQGNVTNRQEVSASVAPLAIDHWMLRTKMIAHENS